MSTTLLRGEQRLKARIESGGSDITFVSSAGVETAAKANIGVSEHEEGTIGGAVASLTIVKSHDFIVPADDLPADFNQATARGYTITFGSDSYRPASFNEQPPLVDSGRFGLLKRIHTKKVG